MVRRSGEDPPAERHAPRLDAALDRSREQDVLPIGRDGEPRSFTQRDVAVHPGIGLELARREQVLAAAPAGIRAVGGEPPDPGPVLATREPVAERDERRPVGQPCRLPEQRVAATGDGGDGPGDDVDRIDPRSGLDVRVPAAVGRERDPGPVGRPGRRFDRGAPDDQRACRPRCRVDQPQVGDVIVDEAGPVGHVVEAVDVPEVGPRRRRPARASVAGRDDASPRPSLPRPRTSAPRSTRPSGDHENASTPRGRSVRRCASPPWSGSRWTW